MTPVLGGGVVAPAHLAHRATISKAPPWIRAIAGRLHAAAFASPLNHVPWLADQGAGFGGSLSRIHRTAIVRSVVAFLAHPHGTTIRIGIPDSRACPIREAAPRSHGANSDIIYARTALRDTPSL